MESQYLAQFVEVSLGYGPLDTLLASTDRFPAHFALKFFLCQTGETVALKKVSLRRLEDGIPNQALREIRALQEIEDNEHVGVWERELSARVWTSTASSSLLAGGEAQGRLPSWHRLCAGV